MNLKCCFDRLVFSDRIKHNVISFSFRHRLILEHRNVLDKTTVQKCESPNLSLISPGMFCLRSNKLEVMPAPTQTYYLMCLPLIPNKSCANDPTVFEYTLSFAVVVFTDGFVLNRAKFLDTKNGVKLIRPL